MNKILISFGLLFIASCAFLGGWTNLDASNLSDSAKKALQLANTNILAQLKSESDQASYLQVTKAQSQVVAGTKYKFNIDYTVVEEGDMAFGRSYEAVVWQQPAGYSNANSAESFVILSIKRLDSDDNNRLNLVMTGGWSNVESNSLDSWGQNALKKAIQAVEQQFQSQNPTLVKVNKAQTQVVAGINYKFEVEFDIGNFEVVVWRQLSGNLQVTQITQLASSLGQSVGGWTQLDSENLSDSAKKAANAAIGHVKQLLQEDNAAFDSIINAQSQVVAGTNYKFHIQFSSNGGIIHYEVTVWARLNGTYVVTEALEANRLGQSIGGWTQLDVQNLSDSALKAANAAIGYGKQLLLRVNGQYDSIVSAQSQIVAGINYKFHIQFVAANGGIIHYEFIVWAKLDGTFKVTNTIVANRLGQSLGDWTQLEVDNLSDSAKQAANAAIGHVKQLLQKINGAFDSIETAQKQVVAGINYKFHIQFLAGEGGRIHYEVTVWAKLDGTFVVTKALEAN